MRTWPYVLLSSAGSSFTLLELMKQKLWLIWAPVCIIKVCCVPIKGYILMRTWRMVKWVILDHRMEVGALSHCMKWMLISVLKFNSDNFSRHTVIEFGCGPGIFSIVASALSRRTRSVIAIDNEPSRISRLLSWICSIKRSMKNNPQPRRYPTVRLGDFTTDEISCYNHAIQSRKVMIYLNNYCDALTGGDVQRKLEMKLSSCRVGLLS